MTNYNTVLERPRSSESPNKVASIRIQAKLETIHQDQNDTFLEAFRTQVENQLLHTNLYFELAECAEGYPHELPDTEAMGPIRLARLNSTEGVIDRLNTPQEVDTARLTECLESRSLEEALETEKEFVLSLVNNPLPNYVNMSSRIADEGLNAHFPELIPVLEVVSHQLLDGDVLQQANSNPTLIAFFSVLTERLTNLLEDKSSLSYFEANLTLELAARFFDIYHRGLARHPDLYHSKRYEYYYDYLLSKKDHLMLPTSAVLSVEDLIRLRPVPIGLIGINSDNQRVDGYLQTPSEFFQHDVNHSRRMYQFFKEYARDHDLSLEELAIQSSFIDNVLGPVIFDNKHSPDPVTVWSRMLCFEVFHEDALPALPDVLAKAIMREELIPTPFESMDEETGTTTYIMEPGATTLAYLFRKLKHDFYDLPDSRPNILGAEFVRTRRTAVEAALRIMEAIDSGCDTVELEEKLEQLVSTDEGFPEAYFETVTDDINRRNEDHSLEMLVSKPTRPEDIISEVRSMGKKVITLFGFSDKGYEDDRLLLSVVRDILGKYNPSEHVVLIGVTAVGIGQAYGMAAEMGFSTAGIVSTKALSWGGEFSPDVKSIFFVRDQSWGGYKPDGSLTPTSRAFMGASDEIHAIGGGLNTVTALRESQRRGMPYTFTPLRPVLDPDYRPAEEWFQEHA